MNGQLKGKSINDVRNSVGVQNSPSRSDVIEFDRVGSCRSKMAKKRGMSLMDVPKGDASILHDFNGRQLFVGCISLNASLKTPHKYCNRMQIALQYKKKKIHTSPLVNCLDGLKNLTRNFYGKIFPYAQVIQHAQKKYVVPFQREFAVFLGDIIQSDHKQGFHKVIHVKYYKQ